MRITSSDPDNATVDIALSGAGGYTLTVDKIGSGTGTVSSTPSGINCGADCSELYQGGSTVTLTAVPTANSDFDGWTTGCSGTDNCPVLMTADTTVTAKFISYSLTVITAGTGTGTVTSVPAGINCGTGGTDCTQKYKPGTSVTLTAAEDANSHFTGWSVSGCIGTTCTIEMNAAKSVTATFVSTYTLTVTKTGTGTGTVTSSPVGINCGADCTETYDSGTPVTLTAAPNSNSLFTGWSGGGCASSGTAPCTVTMTAARNVTAMFTTYVLTVTKIGTGTGTVTSVPAGINCGTNCDKNCRPGINVTLTAVADAKSMFFGWTGGGCSGTGSCQVQMNADITVTAQFKLLKLTVVKAGTGGGTVKSDPVGIICGADCNETYNYGTLVTLTATANTNSLFGGWSGGGCSGTGTCPVTMNNVKTVTATFVPK